MKIPHQIRIKDRVRYEVCWVDAFADPDTLGECRYNTRQIVIKKGQSPQQELKTFLHELAHAVSVERGMNISHKDIYKLEHAIHYLLKANKWI